MKKSIGLWQWAGFAVTSFVGTLLHFLYDLSGEAIRIAPFSGVNESTWEHMKLLFWPMLIYAAVQSRAFRAQENFWCIQCRSILLGLCLIPILFYTYNGVIGRSPDWINIAIFFLSAAAAYLYGARRLRQNTLRCPSPILARLLLATVAALFVLFTFVTPELGIFRDPLTGAYGIA